MLRPTMPIISAACGGGIQLSRVGSPNLGLRIKVPSPRGNNSASSGKTICDEWGFGCAGGAGGTTGLDGIVAFGWTTLFATLVLGVGFGFIFEIPEVV